MNDTSRTLLYWTVPSHISWIISGGHVHLCCHWTKNVCSTTTSEQNGERIGQFLADHAHGQVVEHQPADATGHTDSEAYTNSQNTGDPYTMGPQQPAADSEVLRARIAVALGEIQKWRGTAQRGDRVLMTVNSVLRGDLDGWQPTPPQSAARD